MTPIMILIRKQLLQTLDETLFANLDVTTSAIAWNLVNIASHPTVQQQLYKEILAEKSNPGRESYSYILDDETYLAACVKESARINPIAGESDQSSRDLAHEANGIPAFSVPQSAAADKIIGDWIIPKNVSTATHPIVKKEISFYPDKYHGRCI
jgi:Cytochrome P450